MIINWIDCGSSKKKQIVWKINKKDVVDPRRRRKSFLYVSFMKASILCTDKKMN